MAERSMLVRVPPASPTTTTSFSPRPFPFFLGQLVPAGRRPGDVYFF